MSDADDKSQNPPPPPKPTPKTSTVPLKKETVRITLKARPQNTGDTATVPPVAPMEKSAAQAGGDDEGDKTATVPVDQDRTATAPTAPPPAAPAPPGGAKTIPLVKPPGAPSAPKPPAGAKTIPLAKAPAAGGPQVGKRTTPLQPAGGGQVKPLPRATVQLQKTQAMAGAPTAAIQRGPSATVPGSVVSAPEEEEEETGIMPFAIAVLVLAIIVLVIELLTKLA